MINGSEKTLWFIQIYFTYNTDIYLIEAAENDGLCARHYSSAVRRTYYVITLYIFIRFLRRHGLLLMRVPRLCHRLWAHIIWSARAANSFRPSISKAAFGTSTTSYPRKTLLPRSTRRRVLWLIFLSFSS